MSGDAYPIPPPPIQMTMFREQANWIVGLSLAVLAGATGFVERASPMSMEHAALITATCGSFLLSAGLGILSYFRLGSWASAWDRCHRALATEPSEDATKEVLEQEARVARKQALFEGSIVQKTQRPMLALFFGGFAFSAVLCGAYTWHPPSKAEARQVFVTDNGTAWQIASTASSSVRVWPVPGASAQQSTPCSTTETPPAAAPPPVAPSSATTSASPLPASSLPLTSPSASAHGR
jgi:hypothetical protein